MQLNEYQDKATETALFNEVVHPIAETALGLAGEAGEVADKVKKGFRNHRGVFSKEYAEEIKKELGDVLWYLSQLARLLDMTLEDVAQTNIEKLTSRKERGIIYGEGDNR